MSCDLEFIEEDSGRYGKCGILHFGGNKQRLSRRTFSASAEPLCYLSRDVSRLAADILKLSIIAWSRDGYKVL